MGLLDLLDETLEAFFRATVPLDARDVDVSFEAPDSDWSSKLTRPTVNLFLWDIRRSSERAKAGMETLEREGATVRRLALPRIELRYLVTAWTTEHRDERALLSGLMRTILAHSHVPDDFIADSLKDLPAPALLMTRGGEDHVDVFKTLQGQLKPGLNLVVHTAVEIDAYTPAGPPTEAFDLRLLDRTTGAADAVLRRVAGHIADPDAIGAVVVAPHGKTTVNAAGRFLIAAVPGDEITVDTVPPRTAVVPAVGGVRWE
jgi:hypothetical protein